MFDAEAIHAGISPVVAIDPPQSIAGVYRWFAGEEGRRPAWLATAVKAEPTTEDLFALSEEWARRDPGYLDQVMLLPWEGAPEGDAIDVAADIAKIARYRVANGLTGERWSDTQARLGVEVSD